MGRQICFYLSDHGFGHAARNLPIIMRLLENEAVRITVVCGERQVAFMGANLTQEQKKRTSFRTDHTDVGLILEDGTLRPDGMLLAKETELYLAACPERSRLEADWLKQHRIDAAVCDMPLWSIEACRLADVPLLYIGNFTWTELYREYLPEHTWKRYAVEYGKLAHALLYALHNEEMLEFVGNVGDLEETSLVCRPFHKAAAEEIRRRHKHPLVFVALGMSASFSGDICVENLSCDFIANPGVPLCGSNVERLAGDTRNTQDYVLASDYVITKAGWGTVAEALLAKKPMALFSRDSVLEDRTTIRILESLGHAVPIRQEDLNDIPSVIRRLDGLPCSQFDRFYDASREISEKIVSLGGNHHDGKEC